MQKRILRWLVYNFLFALTPLATVIVIRLLVANLTIQSMQDNLSEVLFFSLMICVTSLSDVQDVSNSEKHDSYIDGLRMFFIFGAVWSSILYGVFLFDQIIGSSIPIFRFRLMWLSFMLAIGVFLVSVAVQVFIENIHSSNENRQN